MTFHRSSLAAAAALLGGCATIFEGSSQDLSFASSPEGARCTLSRQGKFLAELVTPGQVTIRKTKYAIDVTCRKDGFQDASAELSSDSAGATYADVLGLSTAGIGWIVDSATGSDNKYNTYTSVVLPALKTPLPPIASGPAANSPAGPASPPAVEPSSPDPWSPTPPPK